MHVNIPNEISIKCILCTEYKDIFVCFNQCLFKIGSILRWNKCPQMQFSHFKPPSDTYLNSLDNFEMSFDLYNFKMILMHFSRDYGLWKVYRIFHTYNTWKTTKLNCRKSRSQKNITVWNRRASIVFRLLKIREIHCICHHK